MKKKLEEISQAFLKESEEKPIKILSHYDTDGITSAAIMARTLKRLDKSFSIKIVNQLEEKHIKAGKNEILIILDMGSTFLEKLGSLPNKVFVIDHHYTKDEEKENTWLLNPCKSQEEKISAAGLTYLFTKTIDEKDEKLASLGVVGMIGDMLEGFDDLAKEVIEDAGVEIKEGLMLYPATRPINKALEFSSSIYIPGVTGNTKGVFDILEEAGIKRDEDHYKKVVELSKDEISKLESSIKVRTKKEDEELTGKIYLVNFFGRKKDAREISAMVNACSRLGYPCMALSLCLRKENAKNKVEEIYASYKQRLISAINYAEENMENHENYILLNAQDKIEDTIIGTVASIISNSKKFGVGKFVIAMAHSEDKIKVSGRLLGKNNKKDVRKMIGKVINEMGEEYEFGGHPQAAGCLIPKEKEEDFINNLKEVLKLDVVKV